MNRKIIAILGLPGSGKSKVINYLVEKYGWPKVYMGEPTFDELRRLGLPFTEKNERMAREGLRKKYGKLYYAREIIKKIKKIKSNGNVIVESLYMWEEYLEFKKVFGKKFKAIAVYASPEVRYKRLKSRKIRPLSKKDAQGRDYSQIEFHKQGGPIAMADYTIINENSKTNLTEQVDKIIKNIIQT